MTAKKSPPKKAAPKKGKSTMIKIAETIGTVAGEISVKKEQIADMASNAIKAAKSKIHDMTAPKAEEVKNKAKTVEKKIEKKVVKPAAKKVAEIKKSVAKKTEEVTKNVAAAKKAGKKAAKKAGSKK